MDAFERLFGLAAVFSGVLILLLPILLLGLAIPYAVLRIRDSRSDDPDPQVGLKSALHFIYSLSILLIVTGITVLVVDALQEKNKQPVGRPGFGQPQPAAKPPTEFNTQQRTACALIVSGFAIGLLHLLLILGFTNDRRRPEVRRVFVGWRMAIHAVMVLATFTLLVIQVFQKEVQWESIKPTLGTLVVWGVSWVIHLVVLYIYLPQGTHDRLRFTPPTLDVD